MRWNGLLLTAIAAAARRRVTRGRRRRSRSPATTPTSPAHAPDTHLREHQAGARRRRGTPGADTIRVPAGDFQLTQGSLTVDSEVTIVRCRRARHDRARRLGQSRVRRHGSGRRDDLAPDDARRHATPSGNYFGGNLDELRRHGRARPRPRHATATAYSAGGIANRSGTMTIQHSLIDHNFADTAAAMSADHELRRRRTGPLADGPRLDGRVQHARRRRDLELGNAANTTTLERVTLAYNYGGSRRRDAIRNRPSHVSGSIVRRSIVAVGRASTADRSSSARAQRREGLQLRLRGPGRRARWCRDARLTMGGETDMCPGSVDRVDRLRRRCTGSDQRDVARPQGPPATRARSSSTGRRDLRRPERRRRTGATPVHVQQAHQVDDVRVPPRRARRRRRVHRRARRRNPTRAWRRRLPVRRAARSTPAGPRSRRPRRAQLRRRHRGARRAGDHRRRDAADRHRGAAHRDRDPSRRRPRRHDYGGRGRNVQLPDSRPTRSLHPRATDASRPASAASTPRSPPAPHRATPTQRRRRRWRRSPRPGSSGTVLIKQGGKFVRFDPSKPIPDGAEIDVTKGKITLTAILKPGGKPQTATFYDGIFKLSSARPPPTSRSARRSRTAARAPTRPPRSPRRASSGATARAPSAPAANTAPPPCAPHPMPLRPGLLLGHAHPSGQKGVVPVFDQVKKKTIVLRAPASATLAKPRSDEAGRCLSRWPGCRTCRPVGAGRELHRR